MISLKISSLLDLKVFDFFESSTAFVCSFIVSSVITGSFISILRGGFYLRFLLGFEIGLIWSNILGFHVRGSGGRFLLVLGGTKSLRIVVSFMIYGKSSF